VAHGGGAVRAGGAGKCHRARRPWMTVPTGVGRSPFPPPAGYSTRTATPVEPVHGYVIACLDHHKVCGLAAATAHELILPLGTAVCGQSYPSISWRGDKDDPTSVWVARGSRRRGRKSRRHTLPGWFWGGPRGCRRWGDGNDFGADICKSPNTSDRNLHHGSVGRP